VAMDTQKIKERTISGVSVLMLRNFLIQPISSFGFIFLSVFLKKWELGVFWAVSEVVGFLGYFSDIGLAAAVIQKKEELRKEELQAVFTVQQLLVTVTVAIAFLLTPVLEKRFDFQNGRFLYWSLLFGFFTSSLKTLPSVLLERKMRFEKIALVDLAEQVIYTGLAVFLAWRGFGINSWMWAVLGRSLIGVVLMYILSPWPVGINFHLGTIRHLFRFGIPFQLNSFLAMLKDRLINIFLWGILGSEGVGILGWAKRLAQIPLRFIMDQVIRVTFPAYSRLQTNREKLRLAVERSILSINLLIFPVLAGMGFLMPKVVVVFPKYHKWAVGIVPFWFYLGNSAFAAVTTPLVNAFNSIGKVKISLQLMIMWTVLTWILTPLLAKKFGPQGAAFALFLVSSTSIGVWILAKKELGISLRRILLVPFISVLIMLLALFLAENFFPLSLPGILGLVLVGAGVYGGAMFLFAKDDIRWLFDSLLLWVKGLRK